MSNLRRAGIVGIAAVGLFAAGWATGQAKKPKVVYTEGRIAAERFLKPFDVSRSKQRLIRQGTSIEEAVDLGNEMHASEIWAIDQVIRTPTAGTEVAFAVLDAYSAQSEKLQGAVQATQLSSELILKLEALQVAQSARIIELLERIAKK